MAKPVIMLVSIEKAGAISCFLRDNFQVVEVNSESVINSIPVRYPDIVIIDGSVAAEYDINICKRIREISNVPIIIISLEPSDEDIIGGLNSGADDYLTKPLNNKELAVRISAVLRRSRHNKDILRLPWTEINKVRKTINIGGRVTHLTKQEMELLWTFANKPGKVFSRAELMKTVWGFKYYNDTRVVDAYIKKIRKKTQINSVQPWVIRTVFKVGFKLEVLIDKTQHDNVSNESVSCVC